MSHLHFMAVTGWTGIFANPGEQLSLANTPLLVGMSFVIAVLLLISICLQLIPFFSARSKRRATAKSESESAQAPRQFTPDPVFAGADEMDGQLVAVITAALAASFSDGAHAAAGPACGFRVRRIRRLR